MNDLERKLKSDAAAIDAQVPAALRARIDENLEPVRRQAATTPGTEPALWLGLAAAAGLAALALMMVAGRDPVPPTPEFAATPEYTQQQPLPLALRVQPVELTEPLDQELKSLRADLEKVRSAIEQELRLTL